MTRTIYLAAWALVAALFIGCELLSVLTRREYLGTQGLLDRVAGRSNWRLGILFVGWMWVGWHFFAR
jgi:hypothetical protein